ncbi:MAG: thioredoxin family protein [Acetobacteraceae bacterium]|nr:thioredoxin family protein [Acetobacteraceae bacterium]
MARLFIIVLLLLAATPAIAAESAAVVSERATVTLISDTDVAADGKPFRVGLRIRLAPGWHTYWVNPGDAGVAPEVSFTLPPDARASGIAWPAPERLPEGPLMTYGYEHEVVLPVTITPGAAPLVVRAHANWLVCSKICVPEEGNFSLNFPAGVPSPSPQSSIFAATEARTPRPSPFAAIIAADGILSIQGLPSDSVAEAWFLPVSAGVIEPSAPQALGRSAAGITLRLKPGQQFNPQRKLDGVLVLRDKTGQSSYFSISAVPGAVSVAAPGIPLPKVLGLAFLGGLILNLMPCVFPVLAMKAVALLRLHGSSRAAIRREAAFYVLGVLVAFTCLGVLIVTARAGGAGLGWGFQFQSPAFVTLMVWLLFAVGLNLSGVFQVGGRLAGLGQQLTTRGEDAGSFFTGLLAVVVATPCTAPFMGAALAAALSGPAFAAFAVFLAMGLGLAAPYALVAVAPQLARWAPRPGRWMDLLKQALAFPMYGAVIWLVWVLSQQAGPAGVLACGIGLLLIGFAGWALGVSQTAHPRRRRIGQIAALAAVAGALALLPASFTGADEPQSQAREEAGIEPYSLARLSELRAEGRPVFVNMTAAWCITCLVNERVALAPAIVRRAFADHSIAYLKGDWTRQDPEITAFLGEHGRNGVPLYLFYPARAQEPVILPQILTQQIVLDEIANAGS